MMVESAESSALEAVASMRASLLSFPRMAHDGSFEFLLNPLYMTVGLKSRLKLRLCGKAHTVRSSCNSELTCRSRYICNKTTIPLPRVHGFGQEEGLCSDRFKSLAYLIIDYIPGQSLNIKSLAKDTRERRDHFYIQLIDILAQMRQLEFPSAGSLTLDRDGDFVVGPLSDIPSNTVQIDSFGTAPPSKVFTSATEFIRYQFEVLRNAYELPVSEQTLQEIQLELFALGEMERELHNFVDTHAKWERGPFILCHMDLRWPNIIVDDDLNILAVIDWEWSASIPRFLFVPPSWIAGREPQYVTGQEYHAEFTHFHRILLARREISNGHRQLAQEWDIELLSRAELPIALLLRYHSQLTDIFYQTIYPRLFKNPRRMVMKLFDSSTGLASEAQKRYESSQRYTQHLKDDGLFVPDERAKALHELQKIMQQLREKRALKDGLSLQRQTK